MRLFHWPFPVLLVAVSAIVAGGCSDAQGRLDEFRVRTLQSRPDSSLETTAFDGGTENAGDETTDAAETGPLIADNQDGQPCAPPPPNSVSGPALLALDTSLGPGKVILFLGTIDTPAQGDTTAVLFRYHPLDASDRKTRLQDLLTVGPVPLDDGAFSAWLPTSTVDGNANPILRGVPMTTEMTLSGKVCGVRSFYCGTLVGQASGLIAASYTGHYGITLLSDPDAVPEQPRFGCGAGDLMEKL